MPLGVEQFARAVMGRSRTGLYGGRKILSGNKVSEDGGNKSRRTWKPNVQKMTLYSETLGKVQLKVTTHALRCIDKAGGLDQYLLKTSHEELASDVGSELKTKIAHRKYLNKIAQPVAPAAALSIDQTSA